jgi:hypothetical protein
MKIYANSKVRVKQIDMNEDLKLIEYIRRDFGNHENLHFEFLGTYQDYQGRQAYKYNLVTTFDDGTTAGDIEWVAPGKNSGQYYYDMGEDFNDIAWRWGPVESSYPRLPKKSPEHGWPNCKQLEFENDFGDITGYSILRSRESAKKFLYQMLRNRDFPMMMSFGIQGDQEYYEELMRDFDNGGHCYDEDSHTYFESDGKFYSIDDEMELKDAIEIYFAIPNVDSVHHSDADDCVMLNGYI